MGEFAVSIEHSKAKSVSASSSSDKLFIGVNVDDLAPTK